MGILDVPDWLREQVERWKHRLNLTCWELRLKMELAPNGDTANEATCHQFPDVNAARLTFRVDAEEGDEWERYVIHELLHVAHSRIDHAVQDAIIQQLPEAARPLAYEVYRQHVESYTDQLAWSLWALAHEPRPLTPPEGGSDAADNKR